MLSSAVSPASPTCKSSAFDSWGSIGMCASSAAVDLRDCRQNVLLHDTSSADPCERWFEFDSVASSVFVKGAPRAGVCISNVVDVGDVRYLNDSLYVGLPSCSRAQSGPGIVTKQTEFKQWSCEKREVFSGLSFYCSSFI